MDRQVLTQKHHTLKVKNRAICRKKKKQDIQTVFIKATDTNRMEKQKAIKILIVISDIETGREMKMVKMQTKDKNNFRMKIWEPYKPGI